ncbi:serglycin [Rhineura floridana]|uniref:serglycin n=1 Tax=Rhineura floridana TaxID=261503 RepID=UPI002AC81793|nr:serglycin [Rhineura floridana]
MQAKMQILVRRNGRIFMALCVILFMGCTVQGVPVQIGQYAWVRCRPGAHSANCIEERGIRFMIPEGHANMILPPMADPTLMKKFQEHPDTFLVSEDEYGSGNEIEPEYGSGIESDMDASIISDQIQPDPNLKLKLKNEALFLKDNRL